MSGKYFKSLLSKLDKRSARVCIVGMGYVGLPLAIEACKTGFMVYGYDINPNKIALLSKGGSDVDDVPAKDVRKYLDNGRLYPTDNPEVLQDSDVAIICVPTPLSKYKEPDMSYIESAADKIAAHLHEGMLVILESTTYPGTTREYTVPKFESKGFKVGKDIFVAFSPERVDPGNPKWHTDNTPKVVGGVTQDCTNIACAFYMTFLEKIIPISSADAAEMVKLLENTFRSVNIALVNEMAMICDVLGLDIWEIIRAASTKPFGFMPFYPGPGVGGHCIPIDPHYLSWKLKALNFYAHFIELAGEVNYRMPEFALQGIVRHLNEHSKVLKGANVLVLGISYKRDISDVRESPALDVIKLLLEWGATVIYNDPYVLKLRWNDDFLESAELTEKLLKSVDLVVLTTDHSKYDYEWIAKNTALIYDTRNAFSAVSDPDGKIAVLGAKV